MKTTSQIELTFLKGTRSSYAPSKSYRLMQEGIEAVSGYNTGDIFTWATTLCDPTVESVYKTLSAYSLSDYFRINGAPIEFLRESPSLATPRRKVLFPPKASVLQNFDLDGIKVPVETAQRCNWNLSNPSSTANVIRKTLSDMGLSSLAQADFVFYLSSSQFTLQELNCHLYFIFDTPRAEEYMRSVTSGINKKAGKKIFDPAVYKSVQPDYITPPKCINFLDPIPQAARMAVSGGLWRTVSDSAWEADLTYCIDDDWGRALRGQGGHQGGLPGNPIGLNWFDTVVRFVGSADRGINEPSFRAAAQLVTEHGAQIVSADIGYYASMLHAAAWKEIEKKGQRGNPKDKITYDVARFRQYLESAMSSSCGFGDVADSRMSSINDAIARAKLGQVDGIFSRPVLHAMVELKNRNQASWLTVVSRIKKELKGIVSIADIKKAMKDNVKPDGTRRFDAIDPERNEVDNIPPLLRTYDFVVDERDNMYFLPKGEKEVIPIAEGMANIFMRDAQRRGIRPSSSFPKKCMSILHADLIHPDKQSFSFTKAIVGSRIVTLDNGTHLYNLGDGKTLEISLSGIKISSDNQSEVRWKKGYVSNPIPSDTEIRQRFGRAVPLTDYHWISYFKTRLKAYINIDDTDVVKLTSWLVTSVLKEPLAYVLELFGAPGSGKSTAADFLLDLLFPLKGGMKMGAYRENLQGKNDEVLSVLEGRDAVLFDNVRTIPEGRSDLFCRIATGVSYTKRILYTDIWNSMFIKKAVIFTSIAPCVEQTDLKSRSISVELNAIASRDSGLLDRWEADRRYMLLGIMNIICKVMVIMQGSNVDAPPRDVLLGAVHAVLENEATYTSRSMDVSKERKIERVNSIMEEDVFAQTFSCYLQELPPSQTDIEDTTGGIMEKMNAWVESNIGVSKTLLMSDGATKEVRISNVGLPTSPLKFGFALNNAIEAIDEICGFKFESKRRLSHGVVRKYTRSKAPIRRVTTVDQLF